MITDELIARRPRGRTGLADWYSEVFEAQREEGMSTADLSTLLEVKPTNIYYWKRRLRDCDGGRGNGAGAASGLVRVDVRAPEDPERAKVARAGFEVRLRCSRSIIVPPGFDATDLRGLVATLEAC